jgi:hypothetical protein
MTRSASQPIHTHDCDTCVFLGNHPDKDGSPLDLYFCEGRMPTVVARYGSKWHQCINGMELAGHVPELVEAKRRAQAMKLLSDDLVSQEKT